MDKMISQWGQFGAHYLRSTIFPNFLIVRSIYILCDHLAQSNSDNKRDTLYRILVIDDDPDAVLYFKTGLEQANGLFHVDTFTDPEQALSNFKVGLYDILLLDINMPKIDGFELYEQIKKIDNKVKVCFITAYGLYYEALREIFPTINTDCFIRKPISTDELVKRLRAELDS